MGYRRHGKSAIKHACATLSARLISSQPGGDFQDLDRAIGHYAVPRYLVLAERTVPIGTVDLACDHGIQPSCAFGSASWQKKGCGTLGATALCQTGKTEGLFLLSW